MNASQVSVRPLGDPLGNDNDHGRGSHWIEPPTSRLRFGMRDSDDQPVCLMTCPLTHGGLPEFLVADLGHPVDQFFVPRCRQ